MRKAGQGGRAKRPMSERMRQDTIHMPAKKKLLPDDYRPTEDEPFMSERQRAYFRCKLVTWRDEILRSTKETLQHLHDESAQHAALARLDEGTYGYCEETGEPISLKRLDARPIATLSVEAQERHERRERVYRDE